MSFLCLLGPCPKMTPSPPKPSSAKRVGYLLSATRGQKPLATPPFPSVLGHSPKTVVCLHLVWCWACSRASWAGVGSAASRRPGLPWKRLQTRAPQVTETPRSRGSVLPQRSWPIPESLGASKLSRAQPNPAQDHSSDPMVLSHFRGHSGASKLRRA